MLKWAVVKSVHAQRSAVLFRTYPVIAGILSTSHPVMLRGSEIGSNNRRQTLPVADSGASLISAGIEIDLLAALCAGVGLVEFVGENLFAFTAFGAFAGKGFQILEVLIAGAVLGC
jgi:hypothetical protein